MKENMSRVKIIVATHKKYQMPRDEMYLPLHVGAEGKKNEDGEPLDIGYIKDNTGDNISEKNPAYCELTGLYWAWKNLDEEYIGLAHYRRHFGRKTKQLFDGVLTYRELEPMLSKYKIFVPKKRKYYIETLYSHYAHTHYAEHLNITREVLKEKYPEYLQEFDQTMHQRWGYMFNMMIMERTLLNEYCEWLFDILVELERRVDSSELSGFQGRFYGRVSELIFNVWLKHLINSKKVTKSEIMELPYFHLEKINWIKKGKSFIMSKFIGRKYESIF